MPMEKNYCALFVVYDCYNTIYVLLTSDAALNKKFLHDFLEFFCAGGGKNMFRHNLVKCTNFGTISVAAIID